MSRSSSCLYPNIKWIQTIRTNTVLLENTIYYYLYSHAFHSQRFHLIGRSALYMAVQAGKLRVVKELVEAGVNIDLPDKDGRTPLYIATKTGTYILCCVYSLCLTFAIRQ